MPTADKCYITISVAMLYALVLIITIPYYTYEAYQHIVGELLLPITVAIIDIIIGLCSHRR